MCGRLASSLPADEMRRVFRVLGEIPNVEPSWNIVPSQRAAVVGRYSEVVSVNVVEIAVSLRRLRVTRLRW